MKAFKTFCIGVFVTILSVAQLALAYSPSRFVGIGIGLFFVVFGWKIGWTANRGFTALIGHLAMTAGCLVTAYGAYQIPFLKTAPTLLMTLDLPIFWGLFTIAGGYCMITHSYCSCAIRMHEDRNRIRK
jgi:hypothetical protein